MTPDRPDPGPEPAQRGLRVAFVPGVTPDKWARVWRERMAEVPLELTPVEQSDQLAVLYAGGADMCFVRLPVADPALHVIPLYREVPVVVAPRGHFVEAADEVTLADLIDEHRWEIPPLTVREAVETVAAGVGVVVLPMSLARLHRRKDVVHRPVSDAPESQVALAWRRQLDHPWVDAFVGVVRGRTANSTRGAPPASATRAERASSGTGRGDGATPTAAGSSRAGAPRRAGGRRPGAAGARGRRRR